ncbi:hypothetical protein DXG01_014325 [Tephrocybe rancida]|nr:hypothetical protein DXG01_014325 [Tephrocybe rancida]
MSRPPTITHLANIALSELWDPSKELKYYLQQAGELRREANAYLDPPSPPSSSHHEEEHESDYEKAFIKLARAATLVMERIPGHRDFEKVSSEVQRENLKLRIIAWDWAYGVPQQQGQSEATREKGEVRFSPSLQRRETRSKPSPPSPPQPSPAPAPEPGFDESDNSWRLPLEGVWMEDGDTTDDERRGRRIKYPIPVRSFGIFRLTEPPGLETVLRGGERRPMCGVGGGGVPLL